MKKMFLSTLMMLFAVMAFAQTKDNPLAGHPGEMTGTGPLDGYSYECWWKWTPTRDGVIYITYDSDYNYILNCYDEAGTDLKGADVSGNQKAFYVRGGEAVLIKNAGENEKMTLNMEYEPCSSTGLDPNDPVVFAEGTRFYLGDPKYDGDAPYEYHARYYAVNDGVLKLTTHNTVMRDGTTVNGEKLEFGGTAYLGFTANVSVKSGQTYDFVIKSYGHLVFSTTLEQPKKGSIDNPIAIREGVNPVMGAPGTYYYTFQNPDNHGGFAKITSDAVFTDGQVKVYKNYANIAYDLVYEKSQTGSFNVEFETPVFNEQYTYYIEVINKSNSPAGYTFNFEWTRYAEGSDIDNPHMITEFPYNAIAETDFNPVYYAIDVPAGEAWKVMARATGPILNPATKVTIYDPGNKYSRYNDGNSSALYDLLGGEKGYRYIITWESQEAAAIPFEVSKKDIAEGDIIGKPITAVPGENTIASKGTGTKFYTYTATRSGKLAVTVSREGMKVSFPKGTGPYDGEYQFINNGNSSYIAANEGTQYWIKIENLEDGDSFTVTEGDYAAGEDRTSAIDVTETGVYTVENAPLNKYWLKYTVKKDCMLKIVGSMDAAGGAAGYAKNEDFWTTDMKTDVLEGGAFVKKFMAETPAKKGDVFYVNFSVPKLAEGKTFTFIEGDFKLGESIETALTITAGDFWVPTATMQKPVWAKVVLNEGNFHLDAGNRYEGTWYTSKENALNDNGERLDLTRTMTDNMFHSDYTITVPGVYYIKFTDQGISNLNFEASGTAIADEVIPYPHRKMYGFYLRNNAVEGYGLYSMYMDDLQNAEPVYRYDRPDTQLGAFCGAVVDDYWYGVNYIYSMSGPPIPGGFVKINIKNGEYHYIGEWAGADEDGLRFQDMTYDYTTNTMYAIGFNAGESAIYKFDLETAKPERIIDLGIEYLGKKQPMTLGTLACDLEGNFYGMQPGNGTLYKVDITTGIMTPVMETTFTQMPGNQSMEFDRTTGLLYWSSCTYGKDEGQDTWLVVFDLKNNKIYCEENSKMGELASCEGLYIPFVAAGPKAAAASELTVVPGAQGAKKAKVTLTAPNTTFDGRNFLVWLDAITVTRNGEVIKQYENVQGGTELNFLDDPVPADGSYKYAAYATTAVGDGALATEHVYVGTDYPNAISNLVTKTEPGCAAIRLTWNAPVGAAHNGYYDPASLRYRVKRYVRGSSSSSVVAEDLTSPEFVDKSMKRLMSYWYSVTAYNAMGESERVTGDYTIAGPALTAPISEMLTDVTAFQHTWTMKDGNNDLYTWFNRSGMDAYTFGSAVIALEYIISPTMTPPSIDHAADEWVITPPINFESDKTYTISFQTRNLTTETLEVHTGNTNDPESMTKFADLTLEETPTNLDGVIDLVSNKLTLPKLDGINCVGIRLTSPITELKDPENPYTREPAYFQITNFVISEAEPTTGVDATTVAGEDIDITLGENGINISGEFDKAVLYDVSGRMLQTVTNGTVSTNGLNGKVGVLVVTKGTTTKVFKIKL